MFGYCGNRNVILTNFILWCYLIPLSIALYASSKTTFNSEICFNILCFCGKCCK